MNAAAKQQWPVTSRQVQGHSMAGESRYSSSDDDDEEECPEGCRLTVDEHHISPIENLDNTINSLYSYLSGSEGEGDMPHPTHRLAPHRPPGGVYDRRGADPSPCTSSSQSSYESEHDRSHDRSHDIMGSNEGESHYSRINDAATLPSIPPIPPPPLEELTRPHVPPRTTYGGTVYTDRAGYGDRPGRGNQDVENEFEPCFLMQTPSGSVFLPPACTSPQGGPPLPYPRPAAGFPGQPQPQWSPNDETAETSTGATDIDIATQTGLPSSGSVDRQNATLLPPVPTYPAPQNEFHDYSHFQGRSYEMKKRLMGQCTWKCIALIFIFLTTLLSTLLIYFLVMKVYALNWHLQRTPVILLNTTDPNDKVSPVTSNYYKLGQAATYELPPGGFWRNQFHIAHSQFVKVNVTLPPAVIVVYARRSVPPTHAQYDFHEVLDGKRIISSLRQKRDVPGSTSSGEVAHQTAFKTFMDAGLWYLFFYNDDIQPQTVSFVAMKHDEMVTECPQDCHGHGDCIEGQCHCFPGYTSWDCSQSTCPVLCRGNGIFVRGECKCYGGWKGKECAVAEGDCDDPTCGGNGVCVRGQCLCSQGYKGHDCKEVDCLTPDCSGHGVCVAGQCICFKGHQGGDCSLPDLADLNMCVNCSGHGVYDYSERMCRCEEGWGGATCRLEVCNLECVHGHCNSQRCICNDGWMGANCNQRQCDRRCARHGFCNNGNCICKQGWNGRHCSLEGCHNECNNNGACRLFSDGWRCNCRDGWKGVDCAVAMETECGDNVDNDKDGLMDCQDPDCCISSSCKESNHCLTSADPMEILLRKQPPSSTASFYERMRFLIEDDSVQNYATLGSFNHSQVSVIRGKVITSDGSPLIGARVSVLTQPLYGFTLTRELGLFDMLVNGGGSVTLLFQRHPFEEKQMTVMVPWNRIVTMDAVTMTLVGEAAASDKCEGTVHDYYDLRPVILSTWQHTQLGACPSRSTIIPESQVLQESIRVPGTEVYLVYHSSETPGYMSTIMIQLTPGVIPLNLTIILLRVSVEGLVFEKTFEADIELKYKFAWDRRNAYNQKVYGIVTATVAVGYKYSGCKHVFWETQSATMSGYDITSSEIGGWNLHIHHTYNFEEGILHKGDGTNLYLKERPRKVVTVLGNGERRHLNCSGCNGIATMSELLAPVALASGRDGSLYVGDFNFIRKLSANRKEVTSILHLSMSEVPYKYYMMVSPLNGKLYISDYESHRIIQVKTMGTVRDLQGNYEVIAGTGEQCAPGDPDQCGDGGPANRAKLFRPKGIAVNKNGMVFFADGANIRRVDTDGKIDTVVGNQAQPSYWKPLPCGKLLSHREVTLQWPTALAINPLDNTLHIVDNNMVLKLTPDGMVVVVAGRLLHCPPKHANVSSLLTEEQSGPQLATDVILKSPQHITFAQNGDMYIVESDGHRINRVRVVTSGGMIMHYAGAHSKCDCSDPLCSCYDAGQVLATNVLLHSPTAVTITPDSVLHVADMGNLRIHSIVATIPEPNRMGQYHVLYPQTQELYVFNRYGQHVATRNLITNMFMYNFTYNVNSYYGKLVRVIDSGGKMLTIKRDYTTQAKEIVPPGGTHCKFTMDNMGQLQMLVAANNATVRFSYLGNTGLLESKETSEGHTFLYEYDDIGRLATVIQPTGERTVLNTDIDPTGVIARLNTNGRDRVAMTTNGNMFSILNGQSQTKVSYLHDGALVVEYPFQMAVTLETSPHPLLSTQHQLHVKRKIILPDNLVHRLEWRYYLRRERRNQNGKIIDKIGRRMRVNGENLLTVEYERTTHSETVYNEDRLEILRVEYNGAGQPTRFYPAMPIHGLNVSYDAQGRMLLWQRGVRTVLNVYDDDTGNLQETRLADGSVYKYTYAMGTKPSRVTLPSGKEYHLHYDHHGNLRSLSMPNSATHHFHVLTSIGLYRKSYHPPDSHGVFIKDYSSGGQLHQVLYPSNHRRVTYYYNNHGQPSDVYFDWSSIHFTYYRLTGVLQGITVSSPAMLNYSCSLQFGPESALVQQHSINFGKTTFKLINANFGYRYDQNFRIVAIDSTIGHNRPEPVTMRYSMKTGKLNQLNDFMFQYPRRHREVIKDTNMEIIREYNSFSQLTDMWYRFNNHGVFTLEVKYDVAGRIRQWRRKVGSSDLKAFEYVYDADGNVVEVLLGGQPTWKYGIDANGNIVMIQHHSSVREVNINVKDHIESSGQNVYVHDKDGFLVKRNDETFEHNSQGQLVRATLPGKYDICYFYDAYNRLLAMHELEKDRTTQFFYADITAKDRITHVYNHDTEKLLEFFYDHSGALFAMKHDNTNYYIAVDPIGSPILVFNAKGSVVKQMEYDPLGSRIVDSSPRFVFPLGFQGGIIDPYSGLIHFRERVYDPNVGRWTSPDFEQLFERVAELGDKPQIANLYQNQHLVNPHLHQWNSMMDIAQWLQLLGYDLDSLIPVVTFTGHLQPEDDWAVTPERLIPVSSAFECAFKRDMDSFMQISTVPRSSIIAATTTSESHFIKSFAPEHHIFGDGVLLSVEGEKVIVNILDSADEQLALLASTLFNNSLIVDAELTIHGRDLHYFVKPSLDDAAGDVKELSLHGHDMIHGINVTVIQHHATPQRIMFVDIHLLTQRTALNLRYGTSVADEHRRITMHARQRAVKAAWDIERENALLNRHSVHHWSSVETEELVRIGSVSGVQVTYLRDVSQYPELADDPRNIKFVHT